MLLFCIYVCVWVSASLIYLLNMCVRVCAYMYLLLVFPLQVQSSLDVSSCLLKGLSLGDLSRVVGADPDHVSAQEDHYVGTDLKTHMHTDNHEKRENNRTPNMNMSYKTNTVNSG